MSEKVNDPINDPAEEIEAAADIVAEEIPETDEAGVGEILTAAEMADRIRELEQALADKEEVAQQYMRLQADFDNFRKRARQEREDTAKFALCDGLIGLLPVLDNLERALQGGAACEDAKDFVVGVEMVYRQLQDTLKNLGLEVIPAVGVAFDPQWHEAIATVACEPAQSGMVVEELQKGYRFKDKLLRPSMVKVGQ